MLVQIAWRNLSRQKRRSFLLGGAIAFSVFTVVLINGLAGGIQSSIRKNASDLVSGHVFYTEFVKNEKGRLIQRVSDDSPFMAALASAGVVPEAITRRTSSWGTVIAPNSSTTRGVTGIDWKEDAQFGGGLKLVAGSLDGIAGSDGIIISTSLAEILELVPRGKLSFAEREELRRGIKKELAAQGRTSPKELAARLKEKVAAAEAERALERQASMNRTIGEVLIIQLKTVNGQINTGDFRIAGIYEARIDFATYVDRAVLNRLIDMGEGEYNILGVFLKNTAGIDALTLNLHRTLENTVSMFPYEKVAGRSSNELQGLINREDFAGSRGLVTNLNNELGFWGKIDGFALAASLAVMLVILMVIMVGIVNTYRIVVQERTKEIGTLRAIGTLRRDVRRMFVLEALFLSLGGLAAGTVLATLALLLISIPKLTTFTELAWFLDNGHLAFSIQVPVLVAALLIVSICTGIAALIPAAKAAALRPAQAFRGVF